MSTFEHPNNGHREAVSGWSILPAAVFGLFYFAVKGAWRHVILQLLFMAVAFSAFGPAGAMFVFVMWIVYALMAPKIIAAQYLRAGWRPINTARVEREEDPWRTPATPAAAIASTGTEATSEDKTCPFCAELVKAAAIKCKHCGSDLSAPAA